MRLCARGQRRSAAEPALAGMHRDVGALAYSRAGFGRLGLDPEGAVEVEEGVSERLGVLKGDEVPYPGQVGNGDVLGD